MAKNKTVYKLIIDDDGTLKVTSSEAKKLNKTLNQTAKSTDNLNKSRNRYNRTEKGTAQNTSNSTKAFSKQAQTVSGALVPAYAVLAANIFAISAAFNFLKRAADFKLLQDSQVQFANNTGLALQALTVRIQQASKSMLGFREAAEAAAIGTAKGFSGSQLTDLAEGAAKAAAALGRTYTDTFNRLLKGASKAEPELLDELGITLRLKEATEKYGEAIGKAADELTPFERSQAVLVETMRQLDDMYGDIEAKANPFVQLEKTFDKLVRVGTQAVLPIFEAIAGVINRNAKLAIILFGSMALGIIKNFPVIENMKTKWEEWGATQEAALSTSKANLFGYRNQILMVEKDLKAAQLSAEDFAKKATKAGATSKLAQRMASGQNLLPFEKGQLKRALKTAEKNVSATGTVMKGVFKGVSLEIIKDFSASLTAVDSKTKHTKLKFVAAMKTMALQAKVSAAKFKVVWVKALTAVGNAVGKVTKLFGKLISIFSGVGIALLLWELWKTVQTQIYDGTVFVVKMLDKVIGYLVKGINAAVNGIAKGMNWLENKTKDVLNTVIDFANTIATEIVQAMSSVVYKITDGVNRLLTRFNMEPITVDLLDEDEAIKPIDKFKKTTFEAFEAIEYKGTELLTLFKDSAFGNWILQMQNQAIASRESAAALESFREVVEATKESLLEITKGYDKAIKADELLKAQMISARAIQSIDLVGLLEQLDKLPLGAKDRAAAIKSLAVEFKELEKVAPQVYEALLAGNRGNLQQFQTDATQVVTGFRSLADGVETLRESFRGTNLYETLSQFENLESIAESIERSGNALQMTEVAAEAWRRFGEIFGEDVNALQIISDVRALIDAQEELARNSAIAAFAQGAYGESLKALNAQQRIALEIEQNRIQLESKVLTEAARKELELKQEVLRIEERLAAVAALRARNAQLAAGSTGFASQGIDVGANFAAIQGMIPETASKAEALKLVFQQMPAAMSPMLESLKSLGPEGEALNAFAEGTLFMSSAWISALDVMNDKTADWKDKTSAIMNTVAGSIGQIASMMEARNNAAIAAADAEIEAEKRRDGASAASQKKLAAMEKKKLQIERKAFEERKKMLLAQAIMNTAAGIMNAFATAGNIYAAIAMAAVVAAVGHMQIQTIQGMTFNGGGSSAGGVTSVGIGERQNTVNLAQSNSASGELAYFRGESGTGSSGANNYVPGNFTGGPTGAGTGFMVGEQGPELFIPERPGTIVPADETAQATGNPVNVNFNISAIDGRSVESMLRENNAYIINNIREAANSRGEFFLEAVDVQEEMDRHG